MGTLHVIGAGLAGLACAVDRAAAGDAVAVYEAGVRAGGRCRSFHDPRLDRRIDNGNHLILAGNRATMRYLDRVGARGRLAPAPAIAFPFVDLRDGARWLLRPNRGPLPWWLLAPGRRVPGSRAGDYLAALKLARAAPEANVAQVLRPGGALYERLWEPLAVAALNTAAEEGAARLLWPVIVQTFGRGGAACRPFVARDGLSEALVDPAVAWLARRGAAVALGRRLRRIEIEGDRVAGLDFGDRTLTLDADDRVVLALPPARAAALVPGLVAPRASRAIVNAHFRLDAAPEMPAGSPFVGVIGGLAQWVFRRGDVVSVTVSAADALLDTPAEDLAARLWADVARALDLAPGPIPPSRIVKERRATFAQTPAEVARRPPTRTAFANLLLAGDWTDTGLPATIEGAIASGQAAAALAQP